MTERKEWNILYGMPLFCIFILFSWYGHYICLILHWLWCIESTVFVTKDRKFYLSLAYWKVSFIWRVVVILRKYYMSTFSNWIKFPIWLCPSIHHYLWLPNNNIFGFSFLYQFWGTVHFLTSAPNENEWMVSATYPSQGMAACTATWHNAALC